MTFANPFANRICEILTPLIGEFIARGSVTMHTETVGTTPERMTAEHLDPFATELQNALVVFIGSEKAEEIGQRIRDLQR